MCTGKSILILSCIFILLSCEDQTTLQFPHQTTGKPIPVKEFKISILKSLLKADYYTLITLTDKNITVTWKGALINKKDTIVFSKALTPSDSLKKISEINYDTLKNAYENPCIDDGLELKVTFNGIKTVNVLNYYQEEIGYLIHYINGNVSSAFTLWYDREKLVKDYNDCRSK
jgi:hypothetical protein